MSDNPFHDHLDICKQCREHPFSLCLVGEKKMKEAIALLADSDPLLAYAVEKSEREGRS
jgi:hypothetical protein